ncbi:S4 domain-containing protein [Erythrobacter sp.]|jgi:ribosome-associated heat shock protein Hsp15|uniref:S4 domain-containing protein n=1 Tax=Erythrobacter sp. TaxID=1042 RepID=UPI002EC6D7A8|nr:S4 domain-containing protein [Erythrobacter sp.]
MNASSGEGARMRLDRALVYLRFARTRSIARQMIEKRALRINRRRVERVSEHVAIGDVLTFMAGSQVRIVEVLALPDRRASPTLARACYRELDRSSDRSLEQALDRQG